MGAYKVQAYPKVSGRQAGTSPKVFPPQKNSLKQGIWSSLFLRDLSQVQGQKKTMTATDVTGFDAIFSTGFFATFSKLHINTGEKAKNPVESLQWRRRPEIADFCPLSWPNLS